MKISKLKFTFLIGLFLVMTSCEDFLGNETELDFIEVPEQTFREVSYVPVQPILNNFVSPSDIIAGFDELIYVVDEATQEVIVMDESGRELGRKFIPGAKAIAQDRSLDLLVIGTIEDTTNNLMVERSCIYRLDLSGEQGYGLQFAEIANTIVHPFYFKTNALSKDAEVVFNRITVLNDNSFYVSRSGPVNTPTQSGGPDDAILEFNADDQFVTPIVVRDNRGAQFTTFFKKPFAITSTVKPPQISADNRGDFIFTSLDADGILKVQYIEKIESVDGNAFIVKTDWNNDPAQADGFINEPFRFEEPYGLEFTGDGTNYIFVVDRAKDSLYQFTSTGLEGVQPPPASGETKFVRTSFGGSGQGPMQFDSPSAVAYKDRVVYVADAGNGRILRFKLTLDIR